jgi:hypothetical protein
MGKDVICSLLEINTSESIIMEKLKVTDNTDGKMGMCILDNFSTV